MPAPRARGYRFPQPIEEILRDHAAEHNTAYRGRLSMTRAAIDLIQKGKKMDYISKEVDDRLYATAMEFLSRGIQAGFDLDDLRAAVVMALDEIHQSTVSENFYSTGDSTPATAENYADLRESQRGPAKVITKSDIAAAAAASGIPVAEVYRGIVGSLTTELAKANVSRDLDAARDAANRIYAIDPELAVSLVSKRLTSNEAERERALAALEKMDDPAIQDFVRQQRKS